MEEKEGQNPTEKNTNPESETPSLGSEKSIIKTDEGKDANKSPNNESSNDQQLIYQEYRETNRIARRQFLVNTFLAVVTFFLFTISYFQYRSAKEVSELSIKEFENANTPFLTFSKIIEPDTSLQIDFEIANTRDQVVQMESFRSFIVVAKPSFENDKFLQDSCMNITTISNDARLISNIFKFSPKFLPSANVPPDKLTRAAIVLGIQNIYWMGEVIYYNPLDKKRKRKFSWLVKFFFYFPKKAMSVEVVKNNNEYLLPIINDFDTIVPK